MAIPNQASLWSPSEIQGGGLWSSISKHVIVEKVHGWQVVDSVLKECVRPEDMDKPFDPQTMSLLPINIMLEALTMRFKFHFESSKPTNRLDKVNNDMSSSMTHLAKECFYEKARVVLVAYQEHSCISFAFTIEHDSADHWQEPWKHCFSKRLLHSWSFGECDTQTTYNGAQDDQQTTLDESHHSWSAWFRQCA